MIVTTGIAVRRMKNLDRYEREVLAAYEKGTLTSVRPTKAQLAAFRAAARATFRKRSRLTAVSTGTARKRTAR